MNSLGWNLKARLQELQDDITDIIEMMMTTR